MEQQEKKRQKSKYSTVLSTLQCLPDIFSHQLQAAQWKIWYIVTLLPLRPVKSAWVRR